MWLGRGGGPHHRGLRNLSDSRTGSGCWGRSSLSGLQNLSDSRTGSCGPAGPVVPLLSRASALVGQVRAAGAAFPGAGSQNLSDSRTGFGSLPGQSGAPRATMDDEVGRRISSALGGRRHRPNVSDSRTGFGAAPPTGASWPGSRLLTHGNAFRVRGTGLGEASRQRLTVTLPAFRDVAAGHDVRPLLAEAVPGAGPMGAAVGDGFRPSQRKGLSLVCLDYQV